MTKIDQALIEYCEQAIIPKYLKLDKAHQPDHVKEVVKESLLIANTLEVSLNMVYVVACFHDLGLSVNRDYHHVEGGKILLNDQFISNYFSREELIIMKEAIEDHRASNQIEPRSIYGKIISEADRLIDPNVVIKRSFLYRMKVTNDFSFETLYPEVRNHIVSKYGYGGYLKFWLEYDNNLAKIEHFRQIIADEPMFYSLCQEIFNNIK